MKYLLDTGVWLWSVGPSDKISKSGLQILANGGEETYFSAASAWEVAIKMRVGKLHLPEPPGRYLPKRLREQGIHPLAVTQNHSLGVYDLPSHHNDPFDRLLIAQAIAEELVILTADRMFEKYPVEVLWCGK